jgi:NAD(P)-dependent dehydrogenase (short-subunit alcohol dehydrogenase family)
MNLGFKGKKIVVGGGGGAIGQAITNRLESEGAIVINLDIKSGTDLSDPIAVESAFMQIANRFSKIDGYCSSVYGGPVMQKTLDITPEEINASLKHTLFAALYPTLEAARWMVQTGGGSIVLISSINSVLGLGEMGYDLSKGALNRIAPDLAVHHGHQRLFVSTLCPGTVAPAPVWKGYEEGLAVIEASIPDKRATTPEEVAAATAFLLSPYGQMFNGSTILGDRAWSLKSPSPMPK